MYQILTILVITVITGTVGGWASYLIDPVSSTQSTREERRHTRIRYIVLGIISAACVPLFLSLVQSALVTNIFAAQRDGKIEIPYSEFLVFTGICFIAALSARRFLDSVSRQVLRDVNRLEARTEEVAESARQAETKAEIAEQQAGIATDLVDERDAVDQIASVEAESHDLPKIPVPDLNPQEREGLAKMMNVTFRTMTGLARDMKVPRAEAGEILNSLLKGGLVNALLPPTQVVPVGGSRGQGFAF